MKISVETCTLRERFGDAEAIRLIAAAGFEAFDYSFYFVKAQPDVLEYGDYLDRAAELRRAADALGITCNQAHAPFEFRESNRADPSDPCYARILRSLAFAACLGAKCIVVHGINTKNPEDYIPYNLRFFAGLLPYARKFGIKIAVENLFVRGASGWDGRLADPAQHSDFVSRLGSGFTACVDVGHAAITGWKPEDFLAGMQPELLGALHLHDNDLRDDLHMLPYTGRINWNALTSALAGVGYAGDITLEIISFLNRQDNDMLPSALKFAAETANKLRRLVIAARL